MKQYDAYKPSGIEWIGDVPEEWELVKIKFFTSYNDDVLPETTAPDVNVKYVEIADVNCIDGITNSTDYEFKEAPSRARRITQKGDVIVSTVRTYLKAIAKVSEDDLIVSTGFIVLRPKKIHERFLAYSALSESFIFDVISQSVGVSYPAINSSKVVNIKIPVPPQQEQTAIADYLDAKCAKIDKVVAVQQKRIELLKELKQSIITHAVTKGLDKTSKMKDSGIDWIGEIPKGWEVKRLRFLGKSKNGLTYSPSDICDEYDGILVLRSSNIQDSKLTFDDNVFVKNVPLSLMVEKGDIIICSRNGSLSLVGKCALVEDDIIASFGAFMLRYKTTMIPKYASYVITCSIHYYKGLMSTTTVNQLTVETLNNMSIPVPSTIEQLAIADYLDKKCAIIDKQIAKVEKQINLLNEYKQSVITECVTGKRKVC